MSEQLDVMVWSDYLCPWCYLGLDRAEYLEREHGAAVTWLPYDLHPEIPEGGVEARRAHERLGPGEREAYLERLRSLADEAGLELNPPEHVPKTRNALEAAEWARHRDPDRFSGFHRSLFRAYWVEGRDLEDPAVLRELAASEGIDADAMAEALDEGAATEHVDRSTELGQRVGVTGTPGWLIHGKALVPGAQPYETFDRVVARVRAASAEPDDGSRGEAGGGEAG